MNSFEGGQSCDNDGRTSAKLSRTLSGHRESSGTAFSLGFVTKIELENFMCHSSLVLEPGPCINLITGRNGAGKSSIIQVHCIAYFPESIGNTEFFKNYRIHLTHEENFQENPQISVNPQRSVGGKWSNRASNTCDRLFLLELFLGPCDWTRG